MGIDQTQTAQKHKRHWFRFSLRTLLLLTAVVAAACGLIGRRVEQKRKELDAVANLVKLRCEVHWNYEFIDDELHRDATSNGPRWLRGILGDNFFDKLQDVRFLPPCARIGDDDLAPLEDLPDLDNLYLGGTQISDAGLQHIKGLTELRSLWLGHTQIHDAGLKNLARMQQLSMLDLSGTNVTDAGIPSLVPLRRLRILSLNYTKITDIGLKRLALLNQLRELRFSDAHCSKSAISALHKALPNCDIEP